MLDQAQKIDSRDFDKLVTSLISDDDLIRVIRGQLHIEHQLEEIIKAASASKRAANALIKNKFQNKIDVVCALGLSERLLSPLHALRDLRNDFAHKLKAELTQKEARKFYDAFDKEETDLMKSLMTTLPKLQIQSSTIKPRNLAADELFTLCIITLRNALIAARLEVLENA
ncbi:DUF4145 domain-containing protein [Brucella pituitosa]|uniref:DUF4145 domain-containing protein n=1 Tax=Brucella pituitosa TaxID=571256 RepID=UPI000C27BB2D|nr:DUF4145 domain-containing protein [Brucella pituitosa]PJO47211.1 hypothetical protein CWE02_19300 [Brucella pituitosa]